MANISKLPLYGTLLIVGTMGHMCTELSGGKSEENIQFGRPMRRWEDNIKMNF